MNTHGIWPASMLIKGCTFDRTTELDTGGGSTIYRGIWNGENVAVKQVHLFSKAKKACFVHVFFRVRMLTDVSCRLLCGRL
jgi:hypothetical protein